MLGRVGSRLSIGRARFFLRKLGHDIPRTALVIDVGSGGDPHPRADVLVERSTLVGGERTVAFRRTAPTVVADICALPFRDSAFGYSVCSHVLEHVDDPASAAAELSRVSDAGYVETPSDLHERLMPMGWHRWLVRREGDVLVFEGKASPFLDDRLGGYFGSLWGRDRRFMQFVWAHVDDLFVRYEWRGKLAARIVSPPGWSPADPSDDRAGCFDSERDSELKRRLYQALASLRYRRRQ